MGIAKPKREMCIDEVVPVGIWLEKAGVKEEKAAKIVSTFGMSSLKECVRVFDTKYGKYCATFKESVDANNFIAEADEKRFTKRYFG